MVNLHPEARTILNSQSRTNPTTTIQNTTPSANTVQTSNIRRRSGRSSNESTRTIERGEIQEEYTLQGSRFKFELGVIQNKWM